MLRNLNDYLNTIKLHYNYVPHTECKQVDLGVVQLNSQRMGAVLSVMTSWNASIRKQICLAPPWGMLFSEVRKRRYILDHYSTTIKQLQGPQLRSYTLPLSHIPLLPSFTGGLALGTSLPQPHDLTRSRLRLSSHASVLPLQTKQLGSSWNRTSEWNESNSSHQLDKWRIHSDVGIIEMWDSSTVKNYDVVV